MLPRSTTNVSRRAFCAAAAAAIGAGASRALGVSQAREEAGKNEAHGRFGATRIYYNNFAECLLNRYNPNMLYPGLPDRYRDEDWFRTIDMIRAFGFNAFEFWLVPRLFCRQGLDSDYGREFARQMNAVIDYAASRGMPVYMVLALATVGDDWRTLCPSDKAQWRELRFLWDAWTRRLPKLGGVDIFPGDPGGCSLGGCTAETYIDKSVEIAGLVRGNLPGAKIIFNTWGPPFFAWGIVKGPAGWKGEFLPDAWRSAWQSTPERTKRSMEHLLKRLPDFPASTAVAINLGFQPDGIPKGAADARPWAREIAKTNPIQTWNYSLTEGENAVLPHYRLERLFQQRREERRAAPYSGGICHSMSPKLNLLSLYAAAQSFLRPDADHRAVAGEFCKRVFGEAGGQLVPYLPLLEVVRDWGSHSRVTLARTAYHAKMLELVDLLDAIQGKHAGNMPLFPAPEEYRRELLFFARLFADLTGDAPDYDALSRRYRSHVYAIYDRLPKHVDQRSEIATGRLIRHFRQWSTGD